MLDEYTIRKGKSIKDLFSDDPNEDENKED